VKPNVNSVEVHPQLFNNGHPMDGALVGVGSLWPLIRGYLVVRNPQHVTLTAVD